MLLLLLLLLLFLFYIVYLFYSNNCLNLKYRHYVPFLLPQRILLLLRGRTAYHLCKAE